ncbi:hypothetical protein PACTADRAFT_4540 [Pachysolen tannophilus NRRL Y-2460]|uniref:GSKIP domain-containing protein n=1 Tax=Pachysolen tannophilus NRRL Y-2460 TaxID=669874 RepID=A0A1E4TPG9_PACTA|nr:hypothetical protein PACTADRAFT_4540 [Pachysolen tannophilus NRRL Y-2460]
MEDLQQILNEYPSPVFFKELSLIRSNNDIESIVGNKSYLKCLTLESKKFNIYISEDGWYSIPIDLETSKERRYYPTFESLMKQESSKFNDVWNKKFLEMLNDIT